MMSDVLEKTFTGMVQSFFGNSSSGRSAVLEWSLGQSASELKNVSLGLIHFVEKLHNARRISRQEEDFFIKKEYEDWQHKICSPGCNGAVIADLLCRALIANSMGHCLTNLNIHAVKLCQSTVIFQKKIGYIYVSQCLEPECELNVLLVNTVLKDLVSTNALVVASGLTAIPSVMNSDLRMSIISTVTQCLSHQMPYIRKKTAIMIQSIYSNKGNDNYESTIEVIPRLQQLLSDPSPGVAVAATSALAAIYVNGAERADLREQIGSTAAHIICEVLRGGFPKEYNCDNGTISAPFVLLQMLRVIQQISNDDWIVPEEVTLALCNILSQPWGGRELTLYMVLFECVLTTAILPKNIQSITLSLQVIVGFIKSTNVDFKYLGIKGLSNLLKHLGDLVTTEQLEIVLECLYYSDINLRKKTLHLVCNMANAQNYKAVCTTLLEFRSTPENKSFTETINGHLSQILRKFCSDFVWCCSCLEKIIFGKVDCPQYILDTLFIVAEKEMKAMEDKRNFPNESFYREILLKILDKHNGKYLRLCAQLIHLLLKEKNIFARSGENKTFYSDIITKFLQQLEIYCDFNIDDYAILDCLKLLGFKSRTRRGEVLELLLNVYNSKNSKNSNCLEYDYDTRVLVYDVIHSLENHDMLKTVDEKRLKIINGDYIPDLTLSFLDDYVVESLVEQKALNKVRLTPGAKSNNLECASEQLSSISESVNVQKELDTWMGCPLSQDVKSICSEETHSSINSLSTSITTSLSLKNNTWSKEGRINDALKSDTCMKNKSGSYSLNPNFEGLVEVGHEAQETKEENEEENLKMKTSQLAQSLLRGISLSKS